MIRIGQYLPKESSNIGSPSKAGADAERERERGGGGGGITANYNKGQPVSYLPGTGDTFY